MPGSRKFQHLFGRTAQTKILDHVWNVRRRGTNLKQLSKAVRCSYFYTIVALKPLLRQGLVLKEPRGVESIFRPNEKHPIVRSVVG